MAQTEKKENSKKKGIFLKKPLEFGGTLKTDITTTQELAGTINSLFRNILSDYEGCYIGVGQQGLFLTLYFTDKGNNVSEGQIKALKNVTEKPTKSSDVVAKINALKAYTNINNKRMFDLTDDAKEILSSVMDVPANAKINWNNIISEVTTQVNNFGQSYNITVKVDGISINRLLQVLYGNKDEDGKYVQYNTSIIRPVPYSPSTFIINIMQLKTEQLENLAQSTGMLGTVGNIPMVKAY